MNLLALRNQLKAIHPQLPMLLLAGSIGGLLYSWRKLFPASFEALPKPIQALAPTVLGMLVGGATGTDIADTITQAIAGALAGLSASGGHGVLKRLPIPYTGGSEVAKAELQARRDSKRPPPPDPPDPDVAAVPWTKSEPPTRPNWQSPSGKHKIPFTAVAS